MIAAVKKRFNLFFMFLNSLILLRQIGHNPDCAFVSFAHSMHLDYLRTLKFFRKIYIDIWPQFKITAFISRSMQTQQSPFFLLFSILAFASKKTSPSESESNGGAEGFITDSSTEIFASWMFSCAISCSMPLRQHLITV